MNKELKNIILPLIKKYDGENILNCSNIKLNCFKKYYSISLEDLCKKDDLNGIKWKHKYNYDLSIKHFTADELGPIILTIMDLSAKYGSLNIIKWLHSNTKINCSRCAMNDAAGSGHLETVKWLHYNRSEGCTERAMDNAASSGHLEIVQWLHSNRSEGDSFWATECAARNGHLEVIKWFHYNKNVNCGNFAMNVAASCGRLEIVKWISENRIEDGPLEYNIGCIRNSENIDLKVWYLKNIRKCLRIRDIFQIPFLIMDIVCSKFISLISNIL